VLSNTIKQKRKEKAVHSGNIFAPVLSVILVL